MILQSWYIMLTLVFSTLNIVKLSLATHTPCEKLLVWNNNNNNRTYGIITVRDQLLPVYHFSVNLHFGNETIFSEEEPSLDFLRANNVSTNETEERELTYQITLPPTDNNLTHVVSAVYFNRREICNTLMKDDHKTVKLSNVLSVKNLYPTHLISRSRRRAQFEETNDDGIVLSVRRRRGRYPCGRSKIINNRLIIRGDETQKYQWPWAVGVFYNKMGNLEFQCGGTLVTGEFVITAGHCVVDSSVKVLPHEDVSVIVGLYNIQEWLTDGSSVHNIIQIILHPFYEHGFLRNDIALLKFQIPLVYFRKSVIPACLWTAEQRTDSIFGKYGTVVGWGMDENGLKRTPTPRSSDQKVVTLDECQDSNPLIIPFTSAKTLCAGNQNETGPCFGDSGSGMYFYKKNSWYLRAIVSTSLYHPERPLTCNTRDYVVYTDIAKYLTWINFYLKNYELTNNERSNRINRRTTPPTNVTDRMETTNVCGMSKIFNFIVVGGEKTTKGEWPWLVAIFVKSVSSLNFICGGTLISKELVVTAAHCFSQNNDRQIRKEEVIVRLGVHNIQNWVDDSKSYSVQELILSPSFDRKWELKNDIALLRVNRITYSDYVLPACLWGSTLNINYYYDSFGTVIGWGQNEDGLVASPEPRLTRQRIVTTDECRDSNPAFNTLTSSTTLCAGNRNGSGPCNGDSGGGMFLNINGRWVLRGIVSYSLPEPDAPNVCNFVVYTDVSKFLDWIIYYM